MSRPVRRRRIRGPAIAAALLAWVAGAGAAAAGGCAGVRFPPAVTVAGTTLALNGMALREVSPLRIDVYVAALYLEHRSRDRRAVLASRGPRRLVLHFLRSVERSRITGGLTRGFHALADRDRLEARLQRLNGWIPDVEAGDALTFTALPDAGLRVEVRGEARGQIEGADFARAFFGHWLGETPESPGIAAALLGGGCG